jgi:hypothetical protein
LELSTNISDVTERLNYVLMLMDDLVGFAQPETCSEIIVVGNYFATQQLLPRIRTDFPCADNTTDWK